jgi:hypothetical protein
MFRMVCEAEGRDFLRTIAALTDIGVRFAGRGGGVRVM